MVAPDLSLSVPDTGAGLRLTVLNTCNIILAINRHIDLEILEHLFVRVLEIL